MTSIALYAVAVCAYIAANLLVLKIVIAEWQSGNRWIINVNLLSNPEQAKRFFGFGGLLLLAFFAFVLGQQLR